MSDTKTELNNWHPISTAPKDGITIEVRYEDGTNCLAFWSERPVCMLGSTNGGFPPGWAIAPEDDADTNLPIDTPALWREY